MERYLLLACAFAPLLGWIAMAVFSRAGAVALYSALLYATFLGGLGRIGDGLSVANLLAVGLALLELLRLVRTRVKPAAPTLLDAALVGLVAWVLVVAIIRSDDWALLRPPIVILLIVSATKLRPDLDESSFRKLLVGLELGGLMLAACCILQTASSPDLWGVLAGSTVYHPDGGMRVSGLYGNPNDAAFYLVAALCSTMVAALRDQSWRLRLLRLGGGMVMAYAVFLTQSRAAFGSVALIALVVVGRFLKIRAQQALVLGLVIAAPLMLSSTLRGLVEELVLSERPGLTETGRDERWGFGLELVQKHPVLGDASAHLDYEQVFFHNDILEFMADQGVPAGLLFALALAAIGVATWRLGAKGVDGGFGQFILLLYLSELVMSMFHGLLLGGIFFWMLIGLGLSNRMQLDRLPMRAGIQVARYGGRSA